MSNSFLLPNIGGNETYFKVHYTTVGIPLSIFTWCESVSGTPKSVYSKHETDQKPVSCTHYLGCHTHTVKHWNEHTHTHTLGRKPTWHIILMWETLFPPVLPLSSVRTDRTKSPGLDSDSLTRKVPGSSRVQSSFSALGPDRWPWYHLRHKGTDGSHCVHTFIKIFRFVCGRDEM